MTSPLKIYRIQRSLYHSPKSYIQLGWYDTYFIFYDYYTPFNGKPKKSVTSSVNFNIPLEMTSPHKRYLIQCSLNHSPKSYIQLRWYDNYFISDDYYTPFIGKFKTSVTSSVNLDIPLEMTSPPQNISYSAFIISFTKTLHTVGLIWHLFYLLRLSYLFHWKI